MWRFASSLTSAGIRSIRRDRISPSLPIRVASELNVYTLGSEVKILPVGESRQLIPKLTCLIDSVKRTGCIIGTKKTFVEFAFDDLIVVSGYQCKRGCFAHIKQPTCKPLQLGNYCTLFSAIYNSSQHLKMARSRRIRHSLRLPPGVRQPVKTLFAVRWKILDQQDEFTAHCPAAGEAEAGPAGEQPAKE